MCVAVQKINNASLLLSLSVSFYQRAVYSQRVRSTVGKRNNTYYNHTMSCVYVHRSLGLVVTCITCTKKERGLSEAFLCHLIT